MGKILAITVIIACVALGGGWIISKYKTMDGAPQNEVSDSSASSQESAPVVHLLSESAESAMAFAPKTVSSVKGQTFSLDAVVSPGKNKVSGAELHVKYDPAKMKLESFQPSDRFSVELQAAKIDNAKGEASIALGVPLTEASIASPEQVIATLSFVSLNETDSSAVEFQSNSLLSADNETRNVLKMSESAQVTITAK